jgi:hypothetical protein
MSEESREVVFATPEGLCASCIHTRIIESAKGSRFVLCNLSATDARFPKYPRLPVLRCVGYSPKSS